VIARRKEYFMSDTGGNGPMACTFCGRSIEDSNKFFKTVGRPPMCDEVLICDKCMIVLLKRAKWIKNRKIEVIK
jgi:hypothetical protein